MNLRPVLSAALLLASACNGPDKTADDTAADTPSDTGPDTTPPDTAPPTTSPTITEISARISTSSGLPLLSNVFLFVHKDDEFARTDLDGQARFSVPPGRKMIQVTPDRVDHAGLLAPFDAANASMNVEIVLPFAELFPLPETSEPLALSDEVSVTIATGQLLLFAEPELMGVGRLPQSTLDDLALPAGTPVGGWSFEPFGAPTTAPLDLAFDLGLPDGAYRLYTSNWFSGDDWIDLGVVQSVAGVIDAPGALQRLTTMLIVEE